MIFQAKKHSFVTYSNPKNGKIKIRACKHCGTLESAKTGDNCKGKKNAFKDRGWTES